MMPTALIEASNCSSIAGGTGVRRGLFGLGRRDTGIDAAKFGHDWLLCLGISSSLCFGKTLPARRIPARRGKGARSARPGAGPLRRRTAMRQPFPAPFISPVVIPPSVLLSDAFFENMLGRAGGLEYQPGPLR